MIELDGHSLDIDTLWRGAAQAEPCHLADASRPAMEESRAYVETLAAQPRAVYGINTGFGPLSGHRVDPSDLEKHQVHLLNHLTTGQGAPLSLVETRAIMMTRANSLARGNSGIRPAVVELLVDALNHDILPVIPEHGSVGASGDLVPLAHMAQALIGRGPVRDAQGLTHPASEALQAAGLEPVVLRAKEGLALVNGTAVMTGLTALSTHEAGALLGWSELLTAGLFQVQHGAPEVLSPLTHLARGHEGQLAVASHIAGVLRENHDYATIIDEQKWGTGAKPLTHGHEIQDPYSFRCTPQVMGAFQDALWHIEDVVTQELNATTDNPLIFPEDEVVIHGGHFYGQHIAMVADYLRLGVVKLALLLDRQLEQLMNWRYSRGLPPMLAGAHPGVNSGFAGAQILATSLAAEARMLATPASVQTIPTNANNQDVVSMGTHAARWTRRAVDVTWKLVAIQALALCQAAELRGEPEALLGRRMHTVYQRVRQVSAHLGADRPLNEDIAAVVAVLQGDELQRALLPDRARS